MKVRIAGRGRAGAPWPRPWSRSVRPSTSSPTTLASAVEADLLVLAVPDDAIEAVAAEVEPVPTTVLAHLAGSRGSTCSHRTSGGRRSTRWSPCPTRSSAPPVCAPARGSPSLATPSPRRSSRPGWSRLRGRRRRPRRLPRGRLHRVRTTSWRCWPKSSGSAASAGVPLEAYLDLAQGTVDNVRGAGAGGRGAHRAGGPRRHRHDRPASRRAGAEDERPLYAFLAEACRALGADAMRSCGRSRRRERHSTRCGPAAARVGLVPTMGYLHEGHGSLMDRAVAERAPRL